MTQQRALLTQQDIRVNEPTPLRIIIPASQVVQTSLLIVDIASVPERIQIAQRADQTARAANDPASCIPYLYSTTPPCSPSIIPVHFSPEHEKKASVFRLTPLLESGGVLLSRAVASQVPSALRGLTSVFGMGTGGTLSPLPPEIVFHCHAYAPLQLHSSS